MRTRDVSGDADDVSAALRPARRGDRPSVKTAHDLITGIATRAGLDDDIAAHACATTMTRSVPPLTIMVAKGRRAARSRPA